MDLQEVGLDRLVGRGQITRHRLLLGVAISCSPVVFTPLLMGRGHILAIPIWMAAVVLVCLGREGFTIDRRNRVATVWWGYGLPFRRMKRSFSRCVEVTVCRKKTTDLQLGQIKSFPVAIADGAESIQISQPGDYEAARCLARRIARFLDCPLVDATKEPAVQLDVQELDLSLRERIRRSGQVVSWSEPPSGMRCSYEVTGDTIRIEIPRKGVTGSCVGFVALGIAFLAGTPFAWSIAESLLPQSLLLIGGWCLCGCSVGFGLLLVGMGVSRAIERTTVEASPRELCIGTRAFWTSQRIIPAADLQEVTVKLPEENADVDKSRSLVARTETEPIRIDLTGHALEEVEWIRGAIVCVMVAGA